MIDTKKEKILLQSDRENLIDKNRKKQYFLQMKPL